MVVAVADQDLPASTLLQGKTFYAQGRCSQLYTRLQFWLTVLDAAYQSLVVFFVAYGVSVSACLSVCLSLVCVSPLISLSPSLLLPPLLPRSLPK